MQIADPENPFLSGIVLAAGASTRMGQAKPLLPLGDRCLLQRVLDEAVGSCLDEIIIVLGHRAEEIRHRLQVPAARDIRIVVNPEHAQGQSTSLRRGLGATSPRAHAAAILLGDQPQVTRTLIDHIAAAFATASRPVVRPVYSGVKGQRVPGHPVILGRRIWPEVEQLRGDQGARVLLLAHPEWLTEIAVAGDPPGDVDTWEDFQRVVDDERASVAQR